jgi:ribonucleoside-diphosphate reductase beta chain
MNVYATSTVEEVEGELDADQASPFVKLFNRWEQQPWQALSIDLATDRATWQRLPSALRAELEVTICEFGGGDVAVTRLLLPLIEHAPHESWRLYLATQLADEARHAVFFARYHDEVLRGQVTASGGSASAYQEFDNSAYEAEFTPLLAAAVAAAGESAASWHYASTLYHLITEGVLGVSILKIARTLGRSPRMLPGLAEGVAHVFRDESRHITFGRRAALAGLAERHGDTIADAYVTGTRAAARVMIGPGRADPPLTGPAAVQRAQQRRVRLADACERAIRQAQVLGLPVSRPALQHAWDDACERAVRDYAMRWRHEHPLAPLVEVAEAEGAVAGDA